MDRRSFLRWFGICKNISRLLWQFSEILRSFSKIFWKTNLRNIFQKIFCLRKHAVGSWLSNGENRRSLSCSYQKLFKKQPTALTSGADSSRPYQNFRFCVPVISATEHQKMFVQTQHENIEIEFVPFLFRSLMGPSISIEQARQKSDFCYYLNIRDN